MPVDVAAIERWLIAHGSKMVDSAAVVSGFADACRRHGLPLSRLHVGLMVLHPLDLSYVATWTPDHFEQGWLRNSPRALGQLAASPLGPLFRDDERQRSVRWPLHDDDQPLKTLRTLQQEGHTDYVGFALEFSDWRTTRACAFCTQRPGGFSDDEVNALRQLMPAWALVCELRTQESRSRTLLDTYLGAQSGQHVLDGTIARGDGQTLQAVVWMCNLRHFTRLCDELHRDDLLLLLNDYYDVVVGAVEDHGGEVLKFMGDGLLAIFAINDDRDAATACAQALDTVETSIAGMHDTNRQREERDESAIDFGVGIHVGEVHYGNIGAPERLDFTVVGPAVNLTSRILSHTRVVDDRVLTSEAVFARARTRLQERCTTTLKGVEAPQRLYGLSS